MVLPHTRFCTTLAVKVYGEICYEHTLIRKGKIVMGVMCDNKWTMIVTSKVEREWGNQDSGRSHTTEKAIFGLHTRIEEMPKPSDGPSSPTPIAPEFPCDNGQRLQNAFYRPALK